MAVALRTPNTIGLPTQTNKMWEIQAYDRIKYPTSLGLDCEIQAMPAGFGNPAGAVGI